HDVHDLAGFDRQHLARRSPITRATDPSWTIKIRQLKSEPLIQLYDSLRRLIRNNNRPTMLRQQSRGAHLIVPRKTTGAVRRKLYIIRRICIDEIFRLDLQRLNILITEFPSHKHACVLREIARVVDRCVGTERHVEISTLIEPAKPVEAGAVEIVEQLR